MTMEKPPTEEEDERDRRATNIFLQLVAAASSSCVGIWLVNAMVARAGLEECFESGRANAIRSAFLTAYWAGVNPRPAVGQ